MPHSKKPGVFLGNLKTDCTIYDLQFNLMDMLTNIGVFIRTNDVQIINRRDGKGRFGFIYLSDDDDESLVEYVITTLRDKNQRIHYRMASLVERGRNLRVDKIRDRAQKKIDVDSAQSSDKLYPGQDKLKGDVHAQQALDREEDECGGFAGFDNEEDYIQKSWQTKRPEDSGEVTAVKAKPKNKRKNKKKTAAKDNSLEKQMREQVQSKPIVFYDRNAISSGNITSNDTQKTVSGSHLLLHQNSNAVGEKSLLKGVNLGAESRNVEYKAGTGDYVKKHLRKHVSNYMTAFLNSDGGQLYIGVNDQGIVDGIPIGQAQEDKIRLIIDDAIRGIMPAVFPQMYSVSFIPVAVQNDHLTHVQSTLRVIEINIERGPASELYQNQKGEAYIRRDGSIQGPLSASAIQEHTKQKIAVENQRKEQEMENMKIKETELREKMQLLQEQVQILEDEGNDKSNIQTQSAAEEEVVKPKKPNKNENQKLKKMQKELNEMKKLQREEQQQRLQLEKELQRLQEERKTFNQKSPTSKKSSKSCVIS